ncbi:protein S100-A13 isoform 2-T3 [Lycaon pictus]
MAAEPLTELEAAIETVVTTFFTFAGQEGRKGSLSIHEFRELVTQQLPHLLKSVFIEHLPCPGLWVAVTNKHVLCARCSLWLWGCEGRRILR